MDLPACRQSRCHHSLRVLGRGAQGVSLALLTLLALLGVAGCAGPRVKMIAPEPLPALARNANVDVYVGDLQPPYQQVAVIESNAYTFINEQIKLKQLEQLKRRARSLGANAVQNIRLLPKHVEGYTIDERVPFAAWKQGNYNLYFMRGEAVRVPDQAAGAKGAAKPLTLDDVKPSNGWVVDRVAPPKKLVENEPKAPLPGLRDQKK